MVHWGNGYLWTNGGYEYPLMWALIALAITIRGGGELSVDARLGREI
jgi:putative oxidoreductase